jgi:hypothetical protein
MLLSAIRVENRIYLVQLFFVTDYNIKCQHKDRYDEWMTRDWMTTFVRARTDKGKDEDGL